jgi:hypothetical protein
MESLQMADVQERMVINIVLDMPPGVNKLYIPVPSRDRSGRLTAKIVKSNICREWADYAKNQVTFQRSGQTIPYRFKIKLIVPTSALDSDSSIKETLDACQHGGAITNDRHCMGGAWDVDETRPPGSMLVELVSTDDPMPPALLRKLLAKRDQASFAL